MELPNIETPKRNLCGEEFTWMCGRDMQPNTHLENVHTPLGLIEQTRLLLLYIPEFFGFFNSHKAFNWILDNEKVLQKEKKKKKTKVEKKRRERERAQVTVTVSAVCVRERGSELHDGEIIKRNKTTHKQ